MNDDIEELVDMISRLNTHISHMSQAGMDVEMDFVSDDDSDADLIDLISVKQRLWDPELVD